MDFRMRIDLPILVAICIFSASAARRNFDVIFSDIKCTANPTFVINMSCNLDSAPIPRLNIAGNLIKELTDLRLAFLVDLQRSNNENINLIKISNLDSCKLLNGNITQPLLKIYMDVLRKSGPVPEGCPIPVGFHYKFENITIKPDYLPPYVPESTFKIVVELSEGPIGIWNITTVGRIRNKKSQKGLFK